MYKKYFILGLASMTVFVVACNSNSSKSNENELTSNRPAAEIYTAYCVQCHGEDGKKGTLGAKDLTISPLTTNERIDIITNGKRSMPSYKASMSKQEIENVAKYLESLK